MKKLGLIIIMLLMTINIGCGVEKTSSSQSNDAKGVESPSLTSLNTSVITTTSANPVSNSDEVSDIQQNNPIDNDFEKDFNRSSMNEYSILSATYGSLWYDELNNVSKSIIKCYKYQEDQKKVQEYLSSCEDLAQKSSALEFLNWQQTSESPEERGSFTGAAGATQMAQAKIYKDAVIHLIQHYNSMPDRSTEEYQFIYKSQGSELDKIRAVK